MFVVERALLDDWERILFVPVVWMREAAGSDVQNYSPIGRSRLVLYESSSPTSEYALQSEPGHGEDMRR
jgi:hypothetical protein